MPYKRSYTEADWLSAVGMMKDGHGPYSIGTRLGISSDTVKKWVSLYRQFGLVGWVPVSTPRVYPFETKLAAVEAFLAGGTKSAVMAKFSIRNKTQLENWVSDFRRDGADALRSQVRGRRRVRDTGESVDQKVARLEMENAALKKLQALVADERRLNKK